MRERPIRRTSGFTLIEVMVAMVIISMVSALIYGGFTQTAQNKKRVEAELDRNHEIRMGLERMVRELSSAFVSAHLNANPALQVVKTCFVGKESGKGTRIDFTAFAHQRLYRDAHESDQAELSYYVGDDPHDRSHPALIRREQRRIDDDPQQGGQAQVMVSNVVKLDMSYLDPMSLQWLKGWDTMQAAMQPNRLPAQVEIKLTVPAIRGRGRDETYGTRVAIPMRFALNHSIYRR